MKDWIYQHIGKDSIFYHFRYFSEDEGPSILEGLASAGTQRILNKFPILKFLTNKNSISKIYLPLWNLFKKIKWTLNGFSFAFTIHILSKKLSKLSILIYSIHWITQKKTTLGHLLKNSTSVIKRCSIGWFHPRRHVVKSNSGTNLKFAHIQKISMTNIVLHKNFPTFCGKNFRPIYNLLHKIFEASICKWITKKLAYLRVILRRIILTLAST